MNWIEIAMMWLGKSFSYLDKNKYLRRGEYEVEKYLIKISDTDAELLELTFGHMEIVIFGEG